MKKVGILVFSILGSIFVLSCNKSNKKDLIFTKQGHLDSLKQGLINLGDKETVDATIRLLNFQKKYNCGETNGTVIPKTILTQAVNGFSSNGINLPTDTSNFKNWDFLVVYPGIEISESGEERSEPAIFFYKGSIEKNGMLTPFGLPVVNLKFLGGGGGDGNKGGASPPPAIP